jgi:hypothetical protein
MKSYLILISSCPEMLRNFSKSLSEDRPSRNRDLNPQQSNRGAKGWIFISGTSTLKKTTSRVAD